MGWYRSGTVAVTNGSNAVVGTSTAWTNNVKTGDIFTADNLTLYEITVLSDDGHITLDRNYTGTTASGASYAIIQNLSPYPAVTLAAMIAATSQLTTTNGQIGTLGKQAASAAQITGGTIDNTTIGGTTKATGSFTTLSAAGNATVGGTLAVSGQFVTIKGDQATQRFYAATSGNNNAYGIEANVFGASTDNGLTFLHSTDQFNSNSTTIGTLTTGSAAFPALSLTGNATVGGSMSVGGGIASSGQFALTAANSASAQIAINNIATGAHDFAIASGDPGNAAYPTGKFVFRDISTGTNLLLLSTADGAEVGSLSATGNITAGSSVLAAGGIFANEGTGLNYIVRIGQHTTTNPKYLILGMNAGAGQAIIQATQENVGFNQSLALQPSGGAILAGAGATDLGYSLVVKGGNANQMVLDNDGSEITLLSLHHNGSERAVIIWDETTNEFVIRNDNSSGIIAVGAPSGGALFTSAGQQLEWHTGGVNVDGALTTGGQISTSGASAAFCFGDQNTTGTGFAWYCNGGTTYLRDNATSSGIIGFNTSGISPVTDNGPALGGASNRWSTIYSGTGTINTSDAGQKTLRGDGSPTDAEKRVAARLARLVKVFQWNDAIAQKGLGKARLHFGWMAQEVQAAFTAEGLDGFAYGLLCMDEVVDYVDASETQQILRQKTEQVTRPILKVEIVDGVPVQKTVMVTETVPVTVAVGVVDEQGHPVTRAEQRPVSDAQGRSVLDAEGKATFTTVDVSVTHPVPVMETIEMEVPVRTAQPPRQQMGLRYDEATAFVLMHLAAQAVGVSSVA